MSPTAAQDREAGRQAVIELCESFAADLSYYKSAEFDETTARQRFIDPVFAALGWHVVDEERRGPYADVILEYTLTKRTDLAGADDPRRRRGRGRGRRASRG